jgi:hypothetical protein
MLGAALTVAYRFDEKSAVTMHALLDPSEPTRLPIPTRR